MASDGSVSDHAVELKMAVRLPLNLFETYWTEAVWVSVEVDWKPRVYEATCGHWRQRVARVLQEPGISRRFVICMVTVYSRLRLAKIQVLVVESGWAADIWTPP